MSRVGELITIKEDSFDDIKKCYRFEKWSDKLQFLTKKSKFEIKKHYGEDDVIVYNFEVSSVDYPEVVIALKGMEINDLLNQDEVSTYEQKGKELGALVDRKQAAYGNAITQTYEVVKAFMTPYYNEDDKTYTIPQSLLQHLLLQVRIIDKQNRIFNNPDFDLMDESPYSDLGGYGLLGSNMVIDK